MQLQLPQNQIVQATGAGPVQSQYTLTVSCPDRIGVVAEISGFLAHHECFITSSQHFGDTETGQFFMRTAFLLPPGMSFADLTPKFAPIGNKFQMTWWFHDETRKDRVLLLVSKQGHCLNNMLYLYLSGSLRIEIPAIVSNHRDLEQMSGWHRIPFYHLPVTNETRALQEEKIIKLVDDLKIDLVVLARYMQILSPRLCEALAWRTINIHHSFLPSFKGAMPYHQAHARGVKLIGATAHYVTKDLDEGPIIEQDVERVDHTLTVDELITIGRDIETRVLSRAVRWHTQHRVLPNGTKTVVFR
ncbi:formyltetrahydrofolate deformylase [Blastochloris sulfoviridis]|uniref:Formyltetrahydrofolate deformylase n=1 Tax=Blastochloris sulfoviridis TaxID=50712 RepID=A0A5M6I3D2_9HYPH|nr:formyltetrahydrofolate deformylase [Blastochloris sulfoviridis]KAA5602305.1 formyltetrahydrofolate deformylase [Blastochloris sulfoviridis]